MNWLRFKSLFEAETQPRFVSIKPDDSSMHEIYGLMDKMKLPGDLRVAPSELHCTVAYSKTAIRDPKQACEVLLPVVAVGDELAIFGTHSRCLVLKLTSLGARGMFHLIKMMGASYDFPKYEAHVTLCYDLPLTFEVPESIEPINLSFDRVESKVLDDDWSPT